MSSLNNIEITACDNQLVIYAIQWGVCYEICNIKSGNNHAVQVGIQLEAGASFSGTLEANGVNGALSEQKTVTLPAGEYSLVYTGLNWGGPYNFDFTFNGHQYQLQNDASKPLTGAIWNLGNLDLTFSV